MTTTPAGDTLAVKKWPADGLENVPRCPVCGSSKRELLHSGLTDRVFRCAPGTWTLQVCRDCGSGYLDPRPDPATIGQAYSQYCTHGAPGGVDYANASGWRRFRISQRNKYLNTHYGYDLKPATRFPLRLSEARRRRFDGFTGFLKFPGPGARVLDIGCGNGSFLWQMRSLGWDVCGVEPDPQSAARARAAGLDVRIGMIHEHTFPEAHFDAITMNHVIEHLHDPGDTLRRCFKLLKPGGYLSIATPNLNSCGHEHFGVDWLALDPPRHLVLFTESSLKNLLEQCGFTAARPPRVSLKADELFKVSFILRGGGDLLTKHRLPLLTKIKSQWLARRANRVTKQDPTRTEELVLLGRKAV